MSLMEQFLNRVLWWRNPPQVDPHTQDLDKLVARWESTIIRIQTVLTWETPVVSFISLLAVNLIFWGVVWLEWRLYGLVFFILLLAVLADWASQKGLVGVCRAPQFPDQQQLAAEHRVLTGEELCAHIRCAREKARQVYIRISLVRQQQPATFCLVACGGCLALSAVGRACSGVSVLYALLMAAFTAPAICVRYPQFLKRLCLPCNASQPDGDREVEEFLPEPSVSAMRILSQADSHLASPPESLTYHPGDVPSSDLDFLGPDVELPSPRQVDLDLSDSSDVSEPHEIEFKTRHFNGDGSSTSSGEELARGLRFRNSARPGTCTGAVVRREPSTDSSDSFELVSKDDL